MRLGKPEDHEKDNFEIIVINDVTVYTHSSMINYNDQIPLRVDTETTLFGKRLGIYGSSIPAQGCGNCTSCS
ncbi:hypothetical protein [Sporomusa acidovorans]|uniref:hypothetical protein n=1 Tax=Sporomusa acidovorans TaxID=112900 RepID=UPI00116046D3|nr:hypothetical protein [Sporomusa acidovorans]